MAEYTGRKTTSNLDAAVQSRINVSNMGGRVRTVVDSRFEATAWAENDTILLARLPSSAVLLPTGQVDFEAFGSSVTADIGIFNQSGKSDITDNDDALVVDVDISSSGTLNVFDGIALDKIGDPLWSLAGLSSDPVLEFDIKLTLKDANPTDDAAIAWALHYTVD